MRSIGNTPAIISGSHVSRQKKNAIVAASCTPIIVKDGSDDVSKMTAVDVSLSMRLTISPVWKRACPLHSDWSMRENTRRRNSLLVCICTLTLM